MTLNVEYVHGLEKLSIGEDLIVLLRVDGRQVTQSISLQFHFNVLLTNRFDEMIMCSIFKQIILIIILIFLYQVLLINFELVS